MNKSKGKIQNLSEREFLNWFYNMYSMSPGFFEIRFIPDSSITITLDKSVIKFRLSNLNSNLSVRGMISEREIKILRYSSEGLTTKEIADRLNVSMTVVKREKARIFAVLGVSNIGAAISEAIKRGFL